MGGEDVVGEVKGVEEVGVAFAYILFIGIRTHLRIGGSRGELSERETFGLVLTFCINSTRGRGGHESPRWIRALGKGDGRTNRTFGSHPLRTLSSHRDNTDPWRGPLAVLNGRTDDVSILWLCLGAYFLYSRLDPLKVIFVFVTGDNESRSV